MLITRCSNNYGPYQFPEKLIPLMITNALADKSCRSMGTDLKCGTGFTWTTIAAGFMGCSGGRPGEIYNIGGDSKMENIAVVA